MEQTEHDRGRLWLNRLMIAVGLLMIFYHMLAVWKPLFDAILHQNIHLGFAFVMLFLFAARESKGLMRVLLLIGLIIGLVVVTYIHIEKDRLDMWAGFPEPPDIVIGLILVALVTYLTWKSWGAVFPILVGIGVLYALFGHLLGGALGHPKFDFKMVLSSLGIGFSGTYGMMLNASANLIFLFIIFGSMFEVVGIGRFFIEIGNFLGKHLRGGAAQTAVFSSSFVGMCTGAAAANVALTGAYTIPLMKKVGFKPEHAGAIEAMASTGGQLTPPVMGVAIFLMASFLGKTYAELMATALIPAVLYYLCAMFGVILIASRIGVPMLTEKINRTQLINGAPLFIIPMSLITYFLLAHYTPAFAAMVAIASLLVIALLRKETRPPLGELLKGLTSGVVMACTIAMACAMIGMLTSMLTLTGAGPKLAGVIEVLSGGNLLMALVFTAMLAILLGCAMPTPVAYVITALVVAPGLERMGMNMMTAHFFVFYYAILSAVTPPVAGASMVGSQIAGTSYMKTAWESLKLATPFFLLPFYIVYHPVMLSQAQPFGNAVLALVSLAISATAAMVFCQRYLFADTSLVEHIGYLITCIFSLAYAFYDSYVSLVISIVLFTVLVVYQWKKRRVASALPEPAPM
ncbi:MAG: TRAP transporter fused permease subunit [Deltaproteobacteria bacterium]|nr:TRAP transporter fused permease subunit [Deltaproteobacteria bacterium]